MVEKSVQTKTGFWRTCERPSMVCRIAESEDEVRSCFADMLLWISIVNERIQRQGSRYTILPFKLHQFISQTGSVYTTLDQGDDRFITLEPGIYKQDDSSKKPIFPNVFSRVSGHTLYQRSSTAASL